MEPWPVVDDLILHRRTLLAIRTIRDELGGDLREAIDAYHDRAVMLWSTCPEEFAPLREQRRDSASDSAERDGPRS